MTTADEREDINLRWNGDMLRIEASIPATVEGMVRLRQVIDLYLPTVEASERRRAEALSPEAPVPMKEEAE